MPISTILLCAAVRSSSAADHPGIEKLECILNNFAGQNQPSCCVHCTDHPAASLCMPVSPTLLGAAVRSSSAAGDPTTEKLECFLDHRSLLGMLQQQSASSDAAAPQHGSRPPITPRQAAVSDPALLRSRLGREAFLLNYKVAFLLNYKLECFLTLSQTPSVVRGLPQV